MTTAPVVLAEAPGRIQRLAADKGYDADWLRADLRKSGIAPVVPGKRGRKRKIRHDRLRYCERWRIEVVLTQMTKAASFAVGTNRDHVADLDFRIGDDDPVRIPVKVMGGSGRW